MTRPADHLILTCLDCGEEFVFTALARAYFARKGRTKYPERCKHCHIELKKRQRVESGADERPAAGA